MIITRVPFRLPLCGGGTDLPSYYKQFGGHLITASINKFMYVSINEPATSDKIKLYYKFAEQVVDVKDIQHNIIRESLMYHNINTPIEIGSMADLDAGTGMGSSSAFTVGLLMGLNTIRRQFLSPVEIAQEACHIEIDRVGKPIGKQDQYAVALGGINELVISRTGEVFVHPINLDKEIIMQLESQLMLFYTGTTRDANIILSEQGEKIESDRTVVEAMHDIKHIGIDIRKALLLGDTDWLGRLFNDHWNIKKTISANMSSEKIDTWYQLALNNGAWGGKIMGAGGGGLFLLCVRNGRRRELKEVLIDAGLKYVDFRFEFEGAKVITNV
jgi:D-glycero-alpha-D-manno-heptose-7-phosphate kinase